MITSLQNPKIKLVKRLLNERRVRQREKAFVVESTRWLQELVNREHVPHFVLATETWLQQDTHADLVAQVNAPVLTIPENMLQGVSDTENSAGILAVVPMPKIPFPPNPTNLLILDAINMPGNLGAILRTATGAGVDGVLLATGCVDAYNPKVVRAGMGAQLVLPIRTASWVEIAGITADLNVWVADGYGDHTYTKVDWRQPSALIIGNEANGAGSEARNLAKGGVTIPMQGALESLNAAVSAGILLFEIARQRRNAPK
jgi:TrmH family RNA methyltransferase